jgi:hypothetical protein
MTAKGSGGAANFTRKGAETHPAAARQPLFQITDFGFQKPE